MLIFDVKTTGDNLDEDEILQLAIINEKGDILYNNTFKPIFHNKWDTSEINFVSPSDTKECKTFKDCKDDIQKVFNTDEWICSYDVITAGQFLEHNGINLDDKQAIPVSGEYMELNMGWDEENHCFKEYPLLTSSRALGYEWGDGEPNTALGDAKATLFVHESIKDEYAEHQRQKEIKEIEKREAELSKQHKHYSSNATSNNPKKGFMYYFRWFLSIMFIITPFSSNYEGDRGSGFFIALIIALLINPVSFPKIKALFKNGKKD